MEANQEGMKGGKRLMSLDALRGFDMFWIIGGHTIIHSLGKSSGSEFMQQYILSQANHVVWKGFHFWDLIMPLFMFIVGTAMPFSFGKRLACDDSKSRLYMHIIRRFVILFILGMVAAGRLLEYDLSRLLPYNNTLQSIAVGYLICSIVILNLRLTGQVIVLVVILLSYWAVIALIPIPGHQAGAMMVEVNLPRYIETTLLGHFRGTGNHTWILPSITFGATVLMGAIAGQLLRSERSHKAKVLLLLLAGTGCMLVGYVWGFWFPIIKPIWTSSFVLYSGGICLIFLALFYLVIDVWGFRLWAYGFVVIGMNAISVYMATHLFNFNIIGDIFLKGASRWLGDWHGFTRAVAGVLVIWLILWWMYRKKSFIKI